MRVLHVSSNLDPKGGGPAVALGGLAEAQAAAGLEVSIVGTYRAGENLDTVLGLRSAGVEVETVGPAKTPLAWHPRLAGVVRRMVQRADIVHIHALWEEIQHRAARVARSIGRPYVVRPAGMLDPWSLAQSRLKKRIYWAWRLRRNLAGAAAIHFTGVRERDLVKPLAIGVPEIVEPNGVDLRAYEHLPARGAFRSRHPGIDSTRLIVFLGRIYRGKGLEHLVPALALLKRRDVVLVIVGPDWRGYRPEVEAMVKQHGVEDRVVFTGLLQGVEKVAALADADLFCLPSDHENFGVAVVEALAAGTPVLLSDEVGIAPEVVAAGVGGVSSREPGALASEIERWLADEERLRSAAGKARPFVWGAYDWMKIAERWKHHYSQLVRKRVAQ